MTNPEDIDLRELEGKEKCVVCQDCKKPLVVEDDDNNRTDLRCPECWAKMEEEVNIEEAEK